MFRKILLVSLVFFFITASADKKTDSLFSVLNNPSTNDTNKLNTLIRIIKIYSKKNVDTAIIFLNQTIELAQKTKNKKFEGKAYNFFGTIYNEKANYSKAIEYYIKSLKIWDEVQDFTFRSITNLNMANVFVRQKNYKRALECYDDIIKNKDKITIPQVVPAALINSSTIFSAKKDWKEALHRAGASLELSIKNGDQSNMSSCYSSMATIAKEQKQYDKAVEYHQKAIAIDLKINYPTGESNERANLAVCYIELKKFKEARIEITKGLEIAEEYGYKQLQLYCYEVLAKLNESTKNFEDAFKYYTKYVSMKDSMFSQEKAQELIEKEVSYEYGKKEALAKLEQEKKDELAKAESVKHKLIIGFIGLVFLIVLFFSFMLARRLKITHQQKLIIEQKNKEITDSINYAKRLQDAILPQKETILNNLSDAFILYKPKDIVAGDFYFYEEEGGYTFVAVADCTGHGVPGAMVSVVCANALTRCVKEFKLKDPGLILDKAREIVLETFEKSGQDVKDGMDISFCAISAANESIYWAGANTALWYMHNGELKEITANKQPVGLSHDAKPFTSHKIDIAKNDRVYLISDGFADQFGGSKGKKFRSKSLKELMVSLSLFPSREQQLRLDSEFEQWKGKLEQIDDVTILSFNF